MIPSSAGRALSLIVVLLVGSTVFTAGPSARACSCGARFSGGAAGDDVALLLSVPPAAYGLTNSYSVLLGLGRGESLTYQYWVANGSVAALDFGLYDPRGTGGTPLVASDAAADGGELVADRDGTYTLRWVNPYDHVVNLFVRYTVQRNVPAALLAMLAVGGGGLLLAFALIRPAFSQDEEEAPQQVRDRPMRK